MNVLARRVCWRSWCLIVASVVATGVGGCGMGATGGSAGPVDAFGNPAVVGGGDGGDVAGDGSGGPSRVTVDLINGTGLAVDVAFFVSADPGIATPDQLFTDIFRTTEGIGFLSGGVLNAAESARLLLPCDAGLFLGTTGGVFLDPVSGVALVDGGVRRSVRLGPQFDCGDRITFRYILNAEQQPQTTVRVE